MVRSLALVALLSGCCTWVFPTIAGVRASRENGERETGVANKDTSSQPEALVGTSVLVNIGLGALTDVAAFLAFGSRNVAFRSQPSG